MTGRAAVVREANLVEIEEVPVPGPLGPREVLIETEFTFISAGTELANFTGLDPGVHVPGSWNHYPARPGYANCGRVAALGSDVDTLAVGDRIFSQRKHVSHHVLPVDDPNTIVVRVPDRVPSDLGAAVRMGMVAITRPTGGGQSRQRLGCRLRARPGRQFGRPAIFDRRRTRHWRRPAPGPARTCPTSRY